MNIFAIDVTGGFFALDFTVKKRSATPTFSFLMMLKMGAGWGLTWHH